uniref:Glutamate decarboxylase 1 n=1 Tax=Poecilia mexicana TaxID=48701 RepID=A0A3B3Y7A9_9TELE
MAASAPSSSSSSGAGADPNSTNLRPPGYDAWCGVAHGCTRKLGMKICGKFIYPPVLLSNDSTNPITITLTAI